MVRIPKRLLVSPYTPLATSLAVCRGEGALRPALRAAHGTPSEKSGKGPRCLTPLALSPGVW